MAREALASLLAAASLIGCGASAPPPEAPRAQAAPTKALPPKPAPVAEAPRELPTGCEGGGEEGLCLPPQTFVKRLCASPYPGVALAMFQKDSPWSRAYLRGKVEAWNASGGLSSAEVLAFDEEVILLSHRAAPAGGLVVSGAGGGYDVLRWNGSCASLEAEEVTQKLPPRAKSAKVSFRILDDNIQDALRADAKIEKIEEERRQACGAARGSKKCVAAEEKLAAEVVRYVRRGGAIPKPHRLP